MYHWKEKKEALIFLFTLVAIGLFIYFTKGFPASVQGAALGGLLAFYGVVLMAIPVLRVGVYQWIENTVFSDYISELQEDDGTKNSHPRDQRITDLMIQNIFGPYLIGIGTFVNGISGFLDYL